MEPEYAWQNSGGCLGIPLLVKPADAVLGPVEPGDDAKAGLFEHRPHRVGSEQKVRLRLRAHGTGKCKASPEPTTTS